VKKACGNQASPTAAAWRSAGEVVRPLRVRRHSGGSSACEEQKSDSVAHDRDVPFARRDVLQMDHVASMQLPGLPIRRCDGEHALGHGEELDRRGRMVEVVHEVGGAPVRLKPCEEYARRWLGAADVDWRCGRRKILLGESRRQVCKMCLVVRTAIESDMRELRRVTLRLYLRAGFFRFCGCVEAPRARAKTAVMTIGAPASSLTFPLRQASITAAPIDE